MVNNNPEATTVPADGTRQVARKDDGIISNSTLDNTYWTWLTTSLVLWLNTHVHATAAPGPPIIPTVLFTATPPTSMTGKINEGNENVLTD